MRRFQAPDRTWVEQQIEQAITQGTPAYKLLEAVERGLREQKVVLPGVTVLSKIIAQARIRAEERIYDRIYQRLDPPSRTKLSELLMVPEQERTTRFQQLKKAPGRPSPKAFHRELENLALVRTLIPTSLDLSDLHTYLLEQLANTAHQSSAWLLKQYCEPL